MKTTKLFGFSILMVMLFSIPAYAGSNAAACTAEEAKANAAQVRSDKCARTVLAMQRASVPDNVIEDRTGFCKKQDSALRKANRDFIRCKQAGLGMSPRGPRGPLDPRTTER